MREEPEPVLEENNASFHNSKSNQFFAPTTQQRKIILNMLMQMKKEVELINHQSIVLHIAASDPKPSTRFNYMLETEKIK